MGDNQDDSRGKNPLRDDHDAALARADALQRELDRERAKKDHNASRVKELEGQLAVARGKLAELTPPPAEQPEGEPPTRESHLSLETIPTQFPDDGQVSRYVRVVDTTLGRIEQALLFALLAAVVLTAAAAAISDKVVGHHLGRWWFTTVRGGTFTIAILGAVFATHQQRHLAMDLVSRKISPRARLVLGVVLKLFTIAIAVLLFRSGLHQREHIGGTVEEFVSDKSLATVLPIGAVLIMLHCLLHILIDVEYLVRGKLPPERARSGH